MVKPDYLLLHACVLLRYILLALCTAKARNAFENLVHKYYTLAIPVYMYQKKLWFFLIFLAKI